MELRFPGHDDAAALAAAVGESADDLRAWMEWARPDYGVDDARSWIERCTTERQRGAAFEFVFTDSVGRLLGCCGLNRIPSPGRQANLGYWIRSSAAGRGLTPIAVRRLADWAFAHTGLHRLEIVVAVENRRSHRVAEKAGARREAVLRSRLWLYEVPHDAVLYSIEGAVPPDSDPAPGG